MAEPYTKFDHRALGLAGSDRLEYSLAAAQCALTASKLLSGRKEFNSGAKLSVQLAPPLRRGGVAVTTSGATPPARALWRRGTAVAESSGGAISPVTPLKRAGLIGRRAFLGLLGGALSLTGMACATSRQQAQVTLPAKHSIRSDQLLIVSDFRLAKDHPLIDDLKNLRRQVSERLELPLGTKPVMVYLFSNEQEYSQYLQTAFPGYPSRRAYFIQTPGKELAVYTWWGDRIQEDLRHEYTHGLLHAALETVPLWLDEGLAEYFEVAGATPGRVNTEHAQQLVTAVQHGWRPDMDRLETLEKVNHMHREDYRESWAWVHYMLHSSPDTRQVLLNYLHELRTNPKPGPLHPRLVAETPDADARWVSYVASMNTSGLWNPAPPVHRAAMHTIGR